MKNQVLQNLVLSKYQNSENPSKIFQDLNGSLSLRTVERCCKMIRDTGSITFSYSTGRPRTANTQKNIQKVKRLKQKKSLSTQKLSNELDISRSSTQQILTSELGLKPYKKIIQLLITNNHHSKRKKFLNWIKKNL